MPVEKKKSGRPKKYVSEEEKVAGYIERHKRYRLKKKSEREGMEKRIAELENILESSEAKINPIFNLTFQKITQLTIDELQVLKNKLDEKLTKDISIIDPLKIIVNELIENYRKYEFSNQQTVYKQVLEHYHQFSEVIFHLTLYELITIELARRKDTETIDLELNELEKKIITLEKKKAINGKAIVKK